MVGSTQADHFTGPRSRSVERPEPDLLVSLPDLRCLNYKERYLCLVRLSCRGSGLIASLAVSSTTLPSLILSSFASTRLQTRRLSILILYRHQCTIPCEYKPTSRYLVCRTGRLKANPAIARRVQARIVQKSKGTLCLMVHYRRDHGHPRSDTR